MPPRDSRGPWLALTAALVVAIAPRSGPAAPAAGDTAAAPVHLFDYDAQQPLAVRDSVVEVRGGISIHDITYASPKGGRVTAYLVVPAGNGPFAGVLFGHWGPGNRAEFLPEAILYARAGAVSLLPDYPWVRPAPWRRALQYSSGPQHDFEAYVQAVVDLRRGFDLLLARPDVDAKRIGYVGHSYGAQWGAILAAVDRRMRTVVLAGGVPDLAAIYIESDDPDITELRKTSPERVDTLLQVMEPLAARRWVPRAKPIPILFQFAQYEENFREAAMRRYFAAAALPKTEKWYPTGHALNDPQALVDRAAWLRRHIGLRPIDLPPGQR